MEMKIPEEYRCDLPSPQLVSVQRLEEGELWQSIHRDLVEWMTEGTHRYLPPRADHG
jgi:hypothetical protein